MSGLAEAGGRDYLGAMPILPRPASPRALWSDLRLFWSTRPRHQWLAAVLAVLIPIAIAACLLLPSFYVTPQVGYAFVLVAFTTVVLGGMGGFAGALVAGLLLCVIEALCGLFLG